MDVYMVVLRLIHIFAGIYWVGAGFFLAAVMLPTVKRLGNGGNAYMLNVYKHSVFNVGMAIASLLTTLSGVLLYLRVSDGFSGEWMRSTSGIVLGIGAVAGIAAFLHGAARISRSGVQHMALLEEADGSEISTEQEQKLQSMLDLMIREGQISLILLVIAVVGMASARYM